MINTKLILVLAFSLLLSACGQQSNQYGNSAAGKELFNQSTINSAPGCTTCHSTQTDKVIIGPSLAGIADRAGSRVSGQTAEEYLRYSILKPNLFVVDQFSPGLMYQDYQDALTEDQINDLIAYLSTLHLEIVRP